MQAKPVSAASESSRCEAQFTSMAPKNDFAKPIIGLRLLDGGLRTLPGDFGAFFRMNG
jgi:hypothetical protein